MIERLNGRLLWEKRINAFFIAITAGNTISVLAANTRRAEVAAVVASGLALVLTVYGLSRSRDRLVEQHRLAAHALWLLRERCLHLICDLKAGASTADEGRARRDALTKDAALIYASAPETDAKAYAAAKKALRNDEELTFSDKEVDAMLPTALRTGGSTRSP